MSEVYRPWKEVGVFLVFCVGAAGLGRGWFRKAEQLPQPPSVMQAIEALQVKHPGWERMGGDWGVEPSLGTYLIAPPYPPIIRKWYVWPVLTSGKVEDLNQMPFEEAEWKNTIWVRLYQNPDGEMQGWYGPILMKGPFLFYGDQQMLKQIDRDLWNSPRKVDTELRCS